MLSLDKCKEILKAENYLIENGEIAHLRDLLYKIATLQVEIECESDNNTYKNNVA